ncbi:3TM-type holin [Reinekea blandensis]|uniref:Uncharacterized protein n=1 Tax=Reinekea blandensis MED297 TaxID=314283 RepID=A4B8U8_9GAMM|nr:3TM-type holin [Reinekea blandensis]EAR11049.1 hypothetical protein MED297_19217 [Reinekea sp. MED297] [Reinekea blandensis MED297]
MFKEIWNFISGKGASVISSIEETVDEYIYTNEEKFRSKEDSDRFRAELKLRLAEMNQQLVSSEQNFRLEIEKLVHQRERQMEDTYRQHLNNSKDVVLAELKQDDKFTKRARPMVVYAGLFFILLELLGLRITVLSLLGSPEYIVTSSSEVFGSFMWVWGGVVGVYAAGRSAEKRGKVSRLTELATGSGKQKVQDQLKSIEDAFTWSK